MATQRLDLPTLISRYTDEDRCRELLERLRWPEGVKCPRCQSDHLSPIETRHKWDCMDCGYQFSVTAGTVLQDSKLPLSKWMLATYMVCEAKKGISSNQLKRMLGVSYKTSWFLTHRIRGAMGQVHRAQLTGIIEVDETFHGGKYRYPNAERDVFGKPKRGPRKDSNKTVVLGAVARGGQVRLRVAPDRGKRALGEFIVTEIADEAPTVYTDDWSAYRGLFADEDTTHETVNHSEKEWVRGDVHTNTIEGVWSLFKRSVIGTHHHMSVKHLPAYLDEIAFKYNNRDNAHIFRETLRVLVTADPMTYADLIED